MVSEQEEGFIMDRHKWAGLAVGGLAFVSLILKLAAANRGLYMAVLTATVCVTGYAGHMGGVLVHGPGYLAEYAPNSLKPLLGGVVVEEVVPETLDIGALVFYDDVIQPIFNSKCVECHCEEKVKGKLRMDSFEELAKGGDLGDEFVPGDVEKSELHYRVTLESDDDDIMPPGKDDVPMTMEEIALLALWIEKGASPTMTVAEAAPTEDLIAVIEVIAKGEETPVEEPIIAWRDLTPEDQTERLAQANAAAEEIGFSLMPLSAEDERLRLNVINCADDFGDEQLLRLKPIEGRLAWVDLGGSKSHRRGHETGWPDARIGAASFGEHGR